MADTRDFDVIQIARSDGADTGPGYWPVAPATTFASVKKPGKDAAAPEKTPRTKPQMARLTEDDPRFAEWRVKLGILLKQELSPNPEEGSPWYVQFPKGYWLYEKSKHLWVSGYPIKPKLFKSPQEFGLHLIWLLSASKDYRDCCCVHCNVPNIPKSDDVLIVTPAEAPAKPEKIPPRVTPVPLPTILGQPSQSPASEASRVNTPISLVPSVKPITSSSFAAAPIQPQPQSHVQQQQQQQQQHQSQVQQQQKPQVQQQQKPQVQQSQVQQPQAQQPQPQAMIWSLKSPLLFRTGELVWYKNGQTWRLGLIRSPGAGSSELLPIGHGMVPQRNVPKADLDMRPFYAFSVPPVTVPDLRDKMFDEVPWDAMFQASGNDAGKRDLLFLDASKMAAAKIDYSYSLWSPLPDDTNGKSAIYYGCFLGAERVELGDCLRLRSLPAELGIAAPDSVVLGVRYIFTTTDYPGAVFFRGHIYQPIQSDATSTPDDQLPAALREESQWRAQVNPAHRWRWVLVKENVVLKEQSIRGRFYPMHRLMPVLNPEALQAAIARRSVEDQYAHLNNRMDGTGRYIGRKANRVDALGAAVPHAVRLELEGHVVEGAFQI